MIRCAHFTCHACRPTEPERDAEIQALREVADAAEAYRACRDGVQTQGGQSTLDRRTTAARLAAALAFRAAARTP